MQTSMFSYHHLLLILSLTSLLHLHVVFSDLAADRSALVRLRATVRGQTLRWNISSGSSPCSWRGVTCNDTIGRVIQLRLPGSGLRGPLPPNSVGNLTELRVLSLRNNALSGQLPSDLESCTLLQEIHLQGNGFSGEIPESFFSLRNLLRVNFAGNNFSGDISPRFDELTNLRTLYLENNELTGSIPESFFSLRNLLRVNFAGNNFSGDISPRFDELTNLRTLYLENNELTGSIPESFFSLRNLLRVNFAGNNFSGDISPRFDELTNLRTLYLENNEFTGSIPDLNSLVNLRYFNVSFNGLSGSIPSRLRSFSNQSFLGTSLCGSPLASCSREGNELSSGAIAGIALGSFVALLIILFVSFILWRTYRRSRKVLPQRSPIPRSPTTRQNGDVWTPNTTETEQYNRAAMKIGGGGDGLVFLGKGDERNFSLQELLSASAEVMGKGTVGSTYKAYFESGIQVVVKRLKNVCVSEVEFRAKIEEIGSLNHQNLEPLKGYFYGREEKLLLYEPMPKGSLSALLHGYGENSRFLPLEIRAKIAVGTAAAIEYLHSVDGGEGTTHGNIKSSNIFLAGDYDARVAEAGLAQLVAAATDLNGYRAPEVVDTRSGSQKADVYSLGVVVLELLTCREPERMVREEGVELPDWVQTVVEEKGTSAAIDPHLLSSDSEEENRVVELLFVALSCTSRNPDGRPTAAEVKRRLSKICG